MIIIPAIDIKDGRCVRLKQGRMEDETVYSEAPLEVAKQWQDAGAEIIHLVDLDAAIEGRLVNFDTIKEIAESVTVPVQIGGGIRDTKSAEAYLAIKNIARVIIGTAAHSNPEFVAELSAKYPGRIAVGVDAKDGFVAIKGWVEVTDTDAIELAKRLEKAGAAAVIYTDISKDGMLEGPNFKATKRLADSVGMPVIASGGVSKLEDIIELKDTGATSVIVGKALYCGNIDLKEAIEKVKD
ncbi:Phosphoribosylformimino-5-aminoimidazole carboxamide ribotide isomerase [hydrothermal vent metagenome]|uniref:1-(5-phosphoribosyl)-5-[(5-phosphoribosylamino)methylideneamino]imidazole-4-carboxamideisomerase n=1 Tax=hydrothermal vent metagenome TaxID=652676 RepID=A0A3B0R5T1_9ZZZZ